MPFDTEAPFFKWYPNEVPEWLLKQGSSKSLAVLDSSFNPPTLAHRELVLATKKAHSDQISGFILLLSIKNMDKHQIIGANHKTRVSMMEEMAKELRIEFGIENIGVAITSEGRFIDKARIMEKYFKQELNIDIELKFIMGVDTAIRLFDPKYYGDVPVLTALEPLLQRHGLIIADRANVTNSNEFFSQSYVQKLSQNGKILRIFIGDTLMKMSSTDVRSDLQSDGKSGMISKAILKFSNVYKKSN